MMTKIMWVCLDAAPVMRALDLVLEKLSESLELTDKISDSMDRPEEVERRHQWWKDFLKKHVPDDLPEATPEELESWLNDGRDESTRKLGHIGKRIVEVKLLQQAVERGNPSDGEVELIYCAIRNSIIVEVGNLDWQIAARTVPALYKTLEQLRIYSAGLQEFDVDGVTDLTYPFDDFKKEPSEPS